MQRSTAKGTSPFLDFSAYICVYVSLIAKCRDFGPIQDEMQLGKKKKKGIWVVIEDLHVYMQVR